MATYKCANPAHQLEGLSMTDHSHNHMTMVIVVVGSITCPNMCILQYCACCLALAPSMLSLYVTSFSSSTFSSSIEGARGSRGLAHRFWPNTIHFSHRALEGLIRAEACFIGFSPAMRSRSSIEHRLCVHALLSSIGGARGRRCLDHSLF